MRSWQLLLLLQQHYSSHSAPWLRVLSSLLLNGLTGIPDTFEYTCC